MRYLLTIKERDDRDDSIIWTGTTKMRCESMKEARTLAFMRVLTWVDTIYRLYTMEDRDNTVVSNVIVHDDLIWIPQEHIEVIWTVKEA